MKITLFTSNQPRHIALAQALSEIASELFVVQECTTAFPAEIDDYYSKSDVMRRYFTKVLAAERAIFGSISFLPANAQSLALRMGDLNMVPVEALAPALSADLIIVFGSSWIRPPLIDRLNERRTLGLHMGLSPYYRGTGCNFWALWDDRPDLVGGSVLLLSEGLDTGPIVMTARPEPVPDPFELGMRAVESLQNALVAAAKDGSISSLVQNAQQQDRAAQIRYTRNREFTDAVAAQYLERTASSSSFASLRNRN